MGRYADNPAAIRALYRGNEVHRDVYIDQEVYRLEMKHLFANAWVFVGHESQTPNKGDYFSTQIGDQPVIQVRHSDGEVHVLHNRCPHKGTKIVIDRAGNTGKFFRCPYHAWSFKTDGCLLAIPLKKGYENTGFENSDSKKGMRAVGEVRNYRGFIFCRLAETGISFEDFFGESLSSIDNMVDRSPAGGSRLPGRRSDTCITATGKCWSRTRPTPAIRWWRTRVRPVPRSSSGKSSTCPKAPRCRRRWRSSRRSCRPTSSSKTWASGPGPTATAIPGCITRSTPTIRRSRDTWTRWSRPMARKKAKAILNENRHNTVYFPNIMIKGPIQQLRVFIPLAADKTLVESYIYRLVDGPEQLTARTAMYNRMINAPTSIVGHDDLEMYERAQEGLQSDGLEWVNIQRLYEEDEDFTEEKVENGTTERQMRNQFDAWVNS
jgi:phenylpropionate dioxygenase-like ring-hydroxylating dioxygenase large terminal subunit